MKSKVVVFLAVSLLAFDGTAQDSSPVATSAREKLSAVLDEVEAALGKKLKSYPILNLTEKPTAALIKKLADGMPGSLRAKQPILVRTKDVEYAVEALSKAAEGLSRKKIAGLHIVILAPTIEPSRFAPLAEKTGLVFHHAQLEAKASEPTPGSATPRASDSSSK